MRYYFLDASALAKEYLVEPGSERVRSIIKSARVSPPAARVLVSRHSQVEASSAVSGNEREGRVTRAQAVNLLQRIKADFDGPMSPYVILEPNGWIASDASEHTRRHGLKAGDAIQLASALAARAASPPPPDNDFTVICCDPRLTEAARTEGFVVEDPTEVRLFP